MTTFPGLSPAPYAGVHYPAGTDKDAVRARMRKEYPNRSDAAIEQVAQAAAMIDALCAPRNPVGMGFTREPHTGLISLGEDRRAA